MTRRLHNGMVAGGEQPEIPLRRFRVAAEVVTSAPVKLSPAFAELVGDAIWRAFPGGEDGDVETSIEEVPA